MTPLSKALAVGLYFVLAFGGVWLGAKLVNTKEPKVVYVEKLIKTEVNPSVEAGDYRDKCGAFSTHIGSDLGNGVREVGQLKWSPDCRYVAFVVTLVGRGGYVINQDGKLGVYLYDSKTTDQQQIYRDRDPDNYSFGVRWEGNRILVFTDNAGTHQYDLNMGRVLPYEQYVPGTVEMIGVLRLRKKTGPDDLSVMYEVVLDRPFYDPLDAQGRDTVRVFGVSERVGLDKLVGKRVRLEGEIGWGYAESRYLEVNKMSLI